MTTRFLSADLGNSACKLRSFELEPDRAPELIEGTSLASDASLGRAAEAWLAQREPFDACGLSSVAAPALEEELASELERRTARGAFERAPDPGLEIVSPEPQLVGRDRLFAARGALELVPGRECIVVDAGTALTVDAVRRAAAGSALAGVFLGGAIAAGPALCLDALAGRAARLPAVEPRPDAGPLGRDTREALQAGARWGFVGALRELVQRIAEAAGFESGTVVLSGGWAQWLPVAETLDGRPLLRRPELVHRGLVAACSSAKRARDVGGRG